jgi:hypothetical protein
MHCCMDRTLYRLTLIFIPQNMLSQQYLFKASCLFVSCAFEILSTYTLLYLFPICKCILSSLLQDGRHVFISNRSYNDGAKNLIVTEASDKSDLETVIAFENFADAKTSKNIADWLLASHLKAGLKSDYIMCHFDGRSIQCRSVKHGVPVND